jgi:hypothetical protein
MPPNVDKDVLRFVMDNGGRLPTGPTNMNNRCVLTVHPRVALARCRTCCIEYFHLDLIVWSTAYSHIIDGEITPAAIESRLP